MTRFLWPVRVYYEDTDAGGVVYYGNYLRFFERARTEYLRHLGFEQDELRERMGVLLVVRSVNLDFLRPARFNEQLQVSATVETLNKASMVFQQEIFSTSSKENHHGDGEQSVVYCTATATIAAVRATDFRACAVPAEIRTEISRER